MRPQKLTYSFNQDELSFELMGDTPLNEEVNITISIAGQQYVFMGKGHETTTLARTANNETGDNY